MIPKHPLNVEVGDYIKWRGHGVSEPDYLMWWKVVDIQDGVIIGRNREGKNSRTRIEQARGAQWRVLVWEVGDSRADEDPSVLDNWRQATGRRR